MSADRELLELAAKAAGFGDPQGGRTCWTESEYPPKSGKRGALWNYVGHMDTAELWNPLTDDGDALRLAVKLRLAVHTPRQDGRWMTRPLVMSQDRERGVSVNEGDAVLDDPYATTRRAIVRAAAEIGRSLTPKNSSQGQIPG